MWNTRIAACTGTGHRTYHQQCQDRTAKRSERGVTAVALADGAGSASLSFGCSLCS